jgi:hypothetical protein
MIPMTRQILGFDAEENKVMTFDELADSIIKAAGKAASSESIIDQLYDIYSVMQD